MAIGISKVIYKARSSGVEFIITPMTIMAQRIIEQKARGEHPDIDPKPYERPMNNPLVPDDVHPGETNPEYIAAMEEVNGRRVSYTVNATLTMCVHPSQASQEEIIEAYKQEIEFLSGRMMDGFEDTRREFNSPWIVFLHCFGATDIEIRQMMSIIHHRLPLTEVEIRDAYAFFRWVGVQRPDLRVRGGTQESPATEEAVQPANPPVDGGDAGSK